MEDLRLKQERKEVEDKREREVSTAGYNIVKITDI